MATKSRRCSFLICSLLLLLVAVSAREGPAAAEEAPGHVGGKVRTGGGCWRSVMETTRPCARDVFQTMASGMLHMSKDCCVVLVKAGERCVDEIFNTPPLDAAYLPAVASLIP